MKIKKILLKIKKCLLNLWEFPLPPSFIPTPLLIIFWGFFQGSRLCPYIHKYIIDHVKGKEKKSS